MIELVNAMNCLHAVSACGLFGLIWTIQLVHYPLFARIEPSQWHQAHQEHTRGITKSVFPLMVSELVFAAALVFLSPSPLSISLLACAGGNWILTAIFFIPLHHKLSARFNLATIHYLVRLNWLRTALWSLAFGLTLNNLLTLTR